MTAHILRRMMVVLLGIVIVTMCFVEVGIARPTGPDAISGNLSLREKGIFRSMGHCEGDHGFDSAADLNSDGCVNVMDLRLATADGGWSALDSPEGGIAGGTTERIEVDTLMLDVPHCGSGSVRFLLKDNTTPLFGYSLEVGFAPESGSSGAVVANVEMTNFYEQQNLIAAGGATMDPLFSVILDQGDGSVFVSTNTDDGSTVLAEEGVNDVLAEVHFIAQPNAVGEFTYTLGAATALSDGGGFAVPFVFVTGTVIVADGALSDVNNDGAIDVNDLIGVIVAWGECLAPPDLCPEDTNSDGVVDVLDLLNVILTWDCGL